MTREWTRRVVSVAAVIGCLFLSGCEAETQTPVEKAQTRNLDDLYAGGFPLPDGSVPEALDFVCGPFISGHNDLPRTSSTGARMARNSSLTMTRRCGGGRYGTRLRQIVDANPGYQFRDGIGPYAQFSPPDGQAIVYASCEFTTGGGYLVRNPRAYYKFEIATVGLDGTGTQRRTTNQYYDHLPAWSPDGQRIAYLSTGSSRSHWGTDDLRILSVGAADAEPETLARDLGGTAPPQWAPDGMHLAVLRLGRDLHLGDTYATEEVGDMTAAPDSSRHATGLNSAMRTPGRWAS